MTTTNQPADPTAETPTKAITLRIAEALDTKVQAAADETGLSRADVIRLSLDRGVDKLLDQLRGNASAA